MKDYYKVLQGEKRGKQFAKRSSERKEGLAEKNCGEVGRLELYTRSRLMIALAYS